MGTHEANRIGISVVISNYNPKGTLVACIERALQLEALEVIFARHGDVNAADDAALRRLAGGSPSFRLLPHDDNRAAALNRAAEAARGDVLLFLESHVLVPPTLSTAFRAVLEDRSVMAAQGAFETRTNSNWVGVVEDHLRQVARASRQARGLPADEFHVHAAALRRGAFLAAGGFDERLPTLAEVLLLDHFDAAGQLRWMERPVVEHVNHATWSDYLDALEDRGREVALLRRLAPAVARRLYPLPVVDRHDARIRRWRVPLGWIVRSTRQVALLVFAVVRREGVSAFEQRLARRIASLTIRAGFLTAHR